jgi:hypothetical protein
MIEWFLAWVAPWLVVVGLAVAIARATTLAVRATRRRRDDGEGDRR